MIKLSRIYVWVNVLRSIRLKLTNLLNSNFNCLKINSIDKLKVKINLIL